MKLPKKFEINIEEHEGIKSDQRRAGEWCASIVGVMVWLASLYPTQSFVFRGHADSAWELHSSLRRKKSTRTLEQLKSAEDLLLKEIARDFWFADEFGFSPASNTGSSDYERTVAVLQHHGVPTRLLDATADPLVALYFAVTGENAPTTHDNKDGAIILIRSVTPEDGLPIHVIPAPQVSARVTAQRARFIVPVANPPSVASGGGKVPFDFLNVAVSNGSNTDFDNLINKHFLLGDFAGRPLEKAPNILMIKVPKKFKSACREVLRSLGVSGATLFPGSDGYRKGLVGL